MKRDMWQVTGDKMRALANRPAFLVTGHLSPVTFAP